MRAYIYKENQCIRRCRDRNWEFEGHILHYEFNLICIAHRRNGAIGGVTVVKTTTSGGGINMNNNILGLGRRRV